MSRPVVLAGLPLDDVNLAISYLADVQRECQLAAIDPMADRSPGRLGSLAVRLVPTFETLGDTWQAADRRRRGDVTEVAGEVAPEAWDAFASLPGLLDEVRACQARGELLSVEPPGVLDLLTWIVDEIGRQVAGEAPGRWPGAGGR